jgi:hypothetical protein
LQVRPPWPGIYEDFKVTATYEKATRQLTPEATVTAAPSPTLKRSDRHRGGRGTLV